VSIIILLALIRIPYSVISVSLIKLFFEVLDVIFYQHSAIGEVLAMRISVRSE
jgi:hypothetical protein